MAPCPPVIRCLQPQGQLFDLRRRCTHHHTQFRYQPSRRLSSRLGLCRRLWTGHASRGACHCRDEDLLINVDDVDALDLAVVLDERLGRARARASLFRSMPTANRRGATDGSLGATDGSRGATDGSRGATDGSLGATDGSRGAAVGKVPMRRAFRHLRIEYRPPRHPPSACA